MVVPVVRPVILVGTVIAVVLVDVHDGAFAFCVIDCSDDTRQGDDESMVDDLLQLLANALCETAGTNREMHSESSVCEVYVGTNISSLVCLRGRVAIFRRARILEVKWGLFISQRVRCHG